MTNKSQRGEFPIKPDPQRELRTGAWIQHRVLTIIWEKDADGQPVQQLRFRVHEPKEDSSTLNVMDFIETIQDYEIPMEFLEKTPWDIGLPNFQGGAALNHPRLLVLQLDNAINWEFTPTGPGVTAKVEKPSSRLEDCSLYFVDRGNQRSPGQAGAPADCRIAYWSVLERPKDAQGLYDRAFNFHVDFIDSETGRRLQTIFDPNVPDQGGGSIP
ncbi:hypothetical protein GVN21_11665 [Caulobacter sp. SLTY]|uniref:hypothetical protein n=1 Tax=Caulobacter sp. SLTY TaxID=2683262 RepID=UPI0014130479|nr:hypothetical protein [Caulobacter sp. SLTY]NBB16014.1 hypothetical protein [Caulobacter sp. SLTY]